MSASNISSPNSRKRRRDEACGHRHTRARLTPPVESSASEPSISDESALIPTSVDDEDTGLSEVDSHAESESELSESSEDPSSESSSEEDSDAESDSELVEHEGEDGVVRLRANMGKKPKMKLGKEETGPELRSFLDTFLPQLKAANAELEAQRKAGTLKKLEHHDGEGEQYIEMNLGLGVLEEKDPNADDASSSSESSESDTDAHVRTKEKDIVGKLMGEKRRKEEVGIQEIDDIQGT